MEDRVTRLRARIRQLRRRMDNFLGVYEEVVRGVNERFIDGEERVAELELKQD